MVRGLRDPKETKSTARRKAPVAASDDDAAPAMAVPPDHPDAELLAFETQYREAPKAAVDAEEACDKETGRAADKRWNVALDAIATLPAHTADGVAVKVRRLLEGIRDGITDFDEKIARTALEALARLGGKQAVAPPQAPDAVAQSGRQLVRAWAALDANDRQQFKCEREGPERRHLEREAQVLEARKEALQGMAAFTQATSLEGALVQVALAHGLADSVGACGAADCDTCKSDLRHISAALHSAASVLERVGGIDRSEFGVETYMGTPMKLPTSPAGEAP